MEKKKLLITGCGRSGTLYTSEVCREIGLDIQHERTATLEKPIGEDGAASWFMAVDDAQPPFGPSAVDYNFENVLHVVRDPLKVIASFAQFILHKGEFSPDYIERNIPEIGLNADEKSLESKQQLVLQAAKYWFYWNQSAQQKSSKTIQVEHISEELPELCDMLQIKYDSDILKNVSKTTNHRFNYIQEAPWEVKWDDIRSLDSQLFEKIRELAGSYGY